MSHINQITNSWRRLVGHNKVLLMVSGGVDSMALMETALRANVDFEVLHITHDMRPVSETDNDRKIVEEYCADHDVPFHNIAVTSESKTETDYRNLRVSAIYDLTNKLGIKYVATGHHSDDQIETILMKICRGCGLEGLSGIAETSEYPTVDPQFAYVRPLLNTPKSVLIDICLENNVPWHEDITNADADITRNAIRNKVVPLLKQLYPGINSAFHSMADNSRMALDHITNEVSEYIAHHLDEYGSGCFDRKQLKAKSDCFIRYWLIGIHSHNSYSGMDKLKKSYTMEFIKCIKSTKVRNTVMIYGNCEMFFTRDKIYVIGQPHNQK